MTDSTDTNEENVRLIASENMINRVISINFDKLKGDKKDELSFADFNKLGISPDDLKRYITSEDLKDIHPSDKSVRLASEAINVEHNLSGSGRCLYGVQQAMMTSKVLNGYYYQLGVPKLEGESSNSACFSHIACEKLGMVVLDMDNDIENANPYLKDVCTGAIINFEGGKDTKHGHVVIVGNKIADKTYCYCDIKQNMEDIQKGYRRDGAEYGDKLHISFLPDCKVSDDLAQKIIKKHVLEQHNLKEENLIKDDEILLQAKVTRSQFIKEEDDSSIKDSLARFRLQQEQLLSNTELTFSQKIRIRRNNDKDNNDNNKETVAKEPVKEAPVVETAVVEAPVVETPVAETPVVETPVVETPVVEAPVVETPVVEAPVVETPVTNATKQYNAEKKPASAEDLKFWNDRSNKFLGKERTDNLYARIDNGDIKLPLGIESKEEFAYKLAMSMINAPKHVASSLGISSTTTNNLMAKIPTMTTQEFAQLSALLNNYTDKGKYLGDDELKKKMQYDFTSAQTSMNNITVDSYGNPVEEKGAPYITHFDTSLLLDKGNESR